MRALVLHHHCHPREPPCPPSAVCARPPSSPSPSPSCPPPPPPRTSGWSPSRPPREDGPCSPSASPTSRRPPPPRRSRWTSRRTPRSCPCPPSRCPAGPPTVETAPLPEPVDFYGTTLTEAPARVVWTAQPGAEIADGQFQEFEVSAGPLPDAGTRLVLPAHQTYTDGTVVDWVDVARGGRRRARAPGAGADHHRGCRRARADAAPTDRRDRRRGRRRVRGRSDDVGARHARARCSAGSASRSVPRPS